MWNEKKDKLYSKLQNFEYNLLNLLHKSLKKSEITKKEVLNTKLSIINVLWFIYYDIKCQYNKVN